MIPAAQITHWRQTAPWASDDSEDIDLVFMRNEGIGPIFDQTRTALSWIDTKPQRDKRLFPKLYFRFITGGGTPRKIKVEIATREAFSAPPASRSAA